MSTLRTNALEGVDAKNSITIVAGAGNITTTNVQEGLCKAWVHHDQEGTHDIDDSFNIASIVDNAIGRTGYALTNNMSNATYPTPFSGWDSAKFSSVSQGYNKTTSGWSNAHSDAEGTGSAIDMDQKGETVFGDLA